MKRSLRSLSKNFRTNNHLPEGDLKKIPSSTENGMCPELEARSPRAFGGDWEKLSVFEHRM